MENEENLNFHVYTSDEILEKAKEYLENGNYEPSYNKLKQLLEKEPQIPEALELYSVVCEKLGYDLFEKAKNNYKNRKLAKAIDKLERSISLKPGFNDAVELLGSIYFSQLKYDNAISLFENNYNNHKTARSLNILIDGHLKRIEYLINRNNIDPIIKSLEVISELNIENNEIKIKNICFELSNNSGISPNDKIKILEIAKKLFPDEYYVYEKLGNLYENSGNIELTNLNYEKAINIFNKVVDLNKFKDIIIYLDEIEQDGETFSEKIGLMILSCGYLNEKFKKYDNAEICFKKVGEGYSLARVLEFQNKHLKAIYIYERIILETPEKDKAFEKFLELGSLYLDKNDFLLRAGFLYRYLNNLPKAQELLLNLLFIDENNKEAKYNLSLLHLTLNEKDKALKYVEDLSINGTDFYNIKYKIGHLDILLLNKKAPIHTILYHVSNQRMNDDFGIWLLYTKLTPFNQSENKGLIPFEIWRNWSNNVSSKIGPIIEKNNDILEFYDQSQGIIGSDEIINEYSCFLFADLEAGIRENNCCLFLSKDHPLAEIYIIPELLKETDNLIFTGSLAWCFKFYDDPLPVLIDKTANGRKASVKKLNSLSTELYNYLNKETGFNIY